MADIVFNIAKGRAGYYASQAGVGNAALILIPLETTGLVADATMRDYDTVDAILAGASNEQTTIGRKTISAATVTVDDSGDQVTVDVADQTYTAPTGNAVGAFVVAYDPDTTGGDDSSLIPLTKHDVTWTPDGNDATVSFATVVYSAS